MTDTVAPMVVDEDFVRHCRARKDDRVKDANFDIGGDDDIAPMIMLKDEDGPIAFVFVHQINRDHALDAIYRLVSGFGATECWAAFDSHYTETMTNPATGKPWKNAEPGATDGRGEMQRACDEEGACSTGLLTDTIWCHGVRRDGHEAFANMPYHIGYAAHEVHWQEDNEKWFRETFKDDGKTRMDGLVPDVIREAFQQPTATEVVNRRLGEELGRPDLTVEQLAEAMGLSLRRQKLHTWLAVLQVYGSDDRWTIALALRDEEELAIVEESQRTWAARFQASQLFARAMGENVAEDPFAKALRKKREPRPQAVTESGIILP